MSDEQRRQDLGDFLRTRRMRLLPEQVGLIPGGRRRTPGLRREEVAQLANVMTSRTHQEDKADPMLVGNAHLWRRSGLASSL